MACAPMWYTYVCVRPNLVDLSYLDCGLHNCSGLDRYGVTKAFALAIYNTGDKDVASDATGFRGIYDRFVDVHSLQQSTS